MSIAKPRRRWFSFSIKVLLLLLTVLSVWLGVQVERVHRQRALKAAILKAGGQLQYDYETDRVNSRARGTPPGPEWLRNLVGVDYFARIEKVIFTGATDQDVMQLERRDGLRSLFVLCHGKERITSVGMKHLGELTSLEHLWVTNSDQITDEGLVGLERLHHLKVLNLSFLPRVGDAGIKHLAKLSNLKVLGLSGTQLSDAGLEHLKNLKKLQFLTVTVTKVTKAGADRLRKALPKCKVDFGPVADPSA